MIDQNSIDEVLSAADIEQVIGGLIPLKRAGSNLSACCPFHDEKSSSLMVSPAKQLFKCFGCGKGGNVIKFIMEFKHIEFPAAVKELAVQFNVNINETSEARKTPEMLAEREAGWKLMAEAKRMYHRLLMDAALGADGTDGRSPSVAEVESPLQYLLNRGFTRETIALWEIGYAPANFRTISDFVNQEPRRWDLAVKCSLCVEKVEKNYDYFYNKIIIPIHDENGNCISFGGRIWTKEQADKKEAKYINGRETDWYKKDKVLFGMDKARMVIAKNSECILAEGYLDVIMAHQHNINTVVGSCGTAVTDNQVKRLIKIAKHITLAGDADTAGEKSILKAIDTCYTNNATSVEVVEWPQGIKDMDQYLSSAEGQSVPFDSAQGTKEQSKKSK